MSNKIQNETLLDEIIIKSENLKCISLFNSIIDKKSPYNAIKHLQIKTHNNSLRIVATNLEILMLKDISLDQSPVDHEVKVKSNILVDCLKKLTGEISLNIQNDKMIITDSKGRFVLTGCTDKYPEENFDNLRNIGSISEDNFLEAVKSMMINVMNQDKSVCKIIIDKQFMAMVVYDKKRVCFTEANMLHCNHSMEIMISPKYLKDLKKIKGDIHFLQNDRRFLLNTSDEKILIKTIDGNDVDYKKFLHNLDEFCSTKLSLLKYGIERCLITSSELIRNVWIDFYKHNIQIKSYDPTIGFSQYSINAESNFEASISLNGDDLLDILSVCPKNDLVIYKSPNDRDLVIKSGAAHYVIAKLILTKSLPDLKSHGEHKKMIAEEFHEPLNDLNSIVDKKSPYNAIRHIQLKTNENQLILTATNLEIFIIKALHIDNTTELPEIKIKSHIITECLQKLTGEITMVFESEKLAIYDQFGVFFLYNCHERYPDEDISSMELIGSIDSKEFSAAIKSVSINVNPNDKGVCKMITKDHKLSIVVYDKKRICFIEKDIKCVKNIDIMISPKYLKELSKIKGEISLYIKDKRLICKTNTETIVIKNIDGNYIDHSKFIQPTHNSCQVNLSEIKNAVERCLINIQTNTINKLKFTITENKLDINYYDYVDDSIATQSIECTNNLGYDITFQLNGLHVLDMLKLMTEEDLYIFAQSDVREIVFSNLAKYINIKLINVSGI